MLVTVIVYVCSVCNTFAEIAEVQYITGHEAEI